MQKRPVWIVGYRDFGFEVSEIAEDAGEDVCGYIRYESDEARVDPRTAMFIELDELHADMRDNYICAMTSTVKRRQIAERIANLTHENLSPKCIIHPSAVISKTASLNRGSLIMPGAVIAAGVQLGQFALVNRGATIGHHTRLGKYSTVGPGVHVGGNCLIGEQVYLGIGSTILNRVRIGQNCLVAAGAVVVQDVPSNCVVKGVPAKVTETDFSGH